MSAQIGYGVFATRTIPRGSITWVMDPLDQILAPELLSGMPELIYHQVLKYSYLNGLGQRTLCWDHARFVNHSCNASCLSPGFDFEIAIGDIEVGEELTDDYGAEP